MKLDILRRLQALEKHQDPIHHDIAIIEPYWTFEEPITHISCNGRDYTPQEYEEWIRSLPPNHVVYVMRANEIVKTIRGGLL